MGRSTSLLPAVTAAICLGLSACSSDSEPTATPAPTPFLKLSNPDLIPGYDSNKAMNLSGSFVPRHVQGYYFIEILDDASDASYTSEILQLMQQAHADQDLLGIIGEDAARLRRLVLASLEQTAPGSLSDATIIIIARPQDESVLRPAIEASGAELRFGIYTGWDSSTL